MNNKFKVWTPHSSNIIRQFVDPLMNSPWSINEQSTFSQQFFTNTSTRRYLRFNVLVILINKMLKNTTSKSSISENENKVFSLAVAVKG